MEQEPTMKKSFTTLPEIKLVGIKARTSNAKELDPEAAIIGATLNAYFGSKVADAISNRRRPGVTYCIYTEYDSDEHGEYTYFVGEEVTSFEDGDSSLATLSIPAQEYTVYTVGPGQMPGICIEAWQKIWTLTDDELGGERTYLADFEVYDERSIDPQRTILDIYIGRSGRSDIQE